MSKFKILILAILLGTTLMSSCEWLELLPPDGLVLDEYWQTKEDVEATLMGAYSQFAQLDEVLFLYGELRADMISAVNAPNNQKNIINNSIFSTNYLSYWGNFYKIINYCNNVITQAPLVREADNTFKEIDMESYQAEAVFLRSLAYFYLVRVFKDVPYITEPTISDDADFFKPALPGEQILDSLRKDLDIYSNQIPKEYATNRETKGRATKWAMYALLADISLWQFDYPACVEYIEKIETGKSDYFLMTSSTWFDIFKPGNSLESIFELQFDGNGQDNSLYQYTYSSNYYVASDKAIELLDPEETDEQVRGEGSLSISNYNFRIWKYCGASTDQRTFRSSAESKAANFVIYRRADLDLMKAEALSQQGFYAEAEALINVIRQRALLEPISISNSPDAFEDVLLEERAIELAFEGKRWFDLMRMGRRNNFSRKNELIDIIIEEAPSTQKLVLAAKLSNPLGWYLPIYEDELERNSNLVQNPYYDTDL